MTPFGPGVGCGAGFGAGAGAPTVGADDAMVGTAEVGAETVGSGVVTVAAVVGVVGIVTSALGGADGEVVGVSWPDFITVTIAAAPRPSAMTGST